MEKSVMDNFLAELYGTNEPTGDDFEKVAHLDFLQKVAEEEGIDLDELSDEDLEELAAVAAEALDGEGEGADDEEDEGDDFEKEAEGKVEEADFLGRVMAHSFNQEMNSIDEGDDMEKDAASGRAKALKGFKKRMARRAKNLGRRGDTKARALGQRLGAPSVGRTAARGAASGAKAGFNARRPGGRARRMVDFAVSGRTRRALVGAAKGGKAGVSEALRSQRKRGYGALGAGAGLAAAAGGGAAYAANREKRSADEELEAAIQARAWEHLISAGLADNEGNYVPPQELDKTAGGDTDYDVDAAALELLEAEGYPVEWY